MKNLYLTLISALLLLGPEMFAQNHQMPYPRKSDSGAAPSVSPPINTSEGLPFRPRPKQNGFSGHHVVPVQEQIHTPIRWYALENADNPNYWQNVNTERIWLELELGASLSDTEIAEFLVSFDLQEPLKRSIHPHLTNFFVFEKAGNTSADIINMAQAAKSVEGVLFLEPSVIYTGQIVPNDPMWNQQWGPYAIFADEAWDYGTQGIDSWNVLAVVDDAIDWLHEDLTDQVWYGYDYGFNDTDPTLDSEEMTHGTHVTGIMSASNNNGIGIAGICTDTVYFAKVTDNTYFTQNGSYSTAAIINSMYDIATIERVLAINLSLGGGAPSDAAEQAYNFAWNSGKLPIVASGNEAQGNVSYPAAYPACMAVGSIGTEGNELYLAVYSNYGDQQEITAPGGDVNTGFGILSTMPGNLYEGQQGTSMACPHVAGLAGLMKSLNPDLTAFEIRNIINSTAFDLGTEGWDNIFGYGMINAKLAVDVALGQSTSVAETNPSSLKMYPNPASEQLWIDNFQGIQKGDIEIFDMGGKLVQRDALTPKDLVPLNIQDLPEGVYVVRLNGGDQLFTGRFVKTN